MYRLPNEYNPSHCQPMPQSESPSVGALLGGMALVGAAAGYAALALRFRNFGHGNRDRFAAGSAEMKMGEAFSKEWARRAERLGSSSKHGTSQGRHDSTRSSRDDSTGWYQSHAGSSRSRDSHPGQTGPPQWALEELGLSRSTSPPSYAEAKAAYLERALQSHPDSGVSSDPEAFKRVSTAWDELQRHLEKSPVR